MVDNSMSVAAMLEGLRADEYRRLVEQVDRARTAGWNPRTHLTATAAFTPGQTSPQPVSLAAASSEIRSALDRPQGTSRQCRGLAVAALRELASRVLIDEGVTSYAQALSDLALALELEDESAATRHS